MSTDRGTTETTLDRLRDVLDAYGAEPERWPTSEREGLAALIARSADARRLQADAARLDCVLDALPAAPPTPGLEDRILAAAVASPAASPAVASLADVRARRAVHARRRTGWLAAALPLAAAAALAAWLVRAPDDAPDVQVVAVAVTLPATEVDALLDESALASLGDYETPGDQLLAASNLDDVYQSAPWDGCTSADLGCLEVDVLPLEPVSRRQNPTRKEVRHLA